MPIADIDVWRAADLLIKRHGADAAIVAAQRADELLAQGGGVRWVSPDRQDTANTLGHIRC